LGELSIVSFSRAIIPIACSNEGVNKKIFNRDDLNYIQIDEHLFLFAFSLHFHTFVTQLRRRKDYFSLYRKLIAYGYICIASMKLK